MNKLVLADYKNLTEEERADEAYKLEQSFRDYKTQAGNCFIQMGKILKVIRDNHLYRELGHESIIDWFSSPDVSVTPSWAWAFISIYETFVLQYGYTEEQIADIDYTKLKDITTLVKENPDKAEEWLEKARVLRRIDLRKEIRLHRVGLLDQQIAEAESETPDEVKKKIKIIKGDRLEELKKLDSESVGLVATSPPYIVPESEKRYRQIDESYGVVPSYEDVLSYHGEWLREINRILKPDGAVFILGTLSNIFTIGHLLQEMGYMIIRDIVWHKPSPSLKHNIFSLVKSHETILWARKSDKHTNNLVEVENDVWQINHNELHEYYTEKPNLLLDKLISIGSLTDDVILDPFMGDGSVAVASYKLSRRYIGIEPNDEWLKIAKTRVKNL